MLFTALDLNGFQRLSALLLLHRHFIMWFPPIHMSVVDWSGLPVRGHDAMSPP